MENKKEFPIRNVSIRVPWHDDGWKGTICKSPHFNNSCTILKRIADEKFDDREEENAGKSIDDLNERIWPPCVSERGMFMSPFDYHVTVVHPYKRFSKLHQHFEPTDFRNATFSASVVPFKWMLRENIEFYAKEYGIDCSEEYEPDIGFKSSWTQSFHNQTTLLNTFFGHLKPEKSLCFFYAKNVPFVEESGRILIGVGKINKIGPPVEHSFPDDNSNFNDNKIRSMIWERNIQHSIRKGFDDGFILPYQEVLEYCKENPNSDLDPAEIAVIVPDDHKIEFAYASEFVTPDASINVLLRTIQSLDKIKEHIPGPWEKIKKWIDIQLGDLWKQRGPYPGMGSVLRSFGIDLGNLLANEINEKIESGLNHWDILDQIFEDPQSNLPQELSSQIGRIHKKKWQKLSKERKTFLELLSRFEINPEQAKIFYNKDNRENEQIFCEDKDIIENPYLLYELSRQKNEAIDFWRIDYGLFPDPSITKNYPIPEPSRMDFRLDERRIRAIILVILEKASRDGHTLLPSSHIISKINKLSAEPPFDLDSETLELIEDDFDGIIEIVNMQDGSKAYKLSYLAKMGKIIKETVEERLETNKIEINQDWRKLIDEIFSKDPLLNEKVNSVMEEKARKEKSMALKILAESRISVLIGPAGTGKTKLLSVLCSQENIKNEGILLLAPTGKARVKLEEGVKDLGLKAKTLAQFLIKNDRYDGETGRYHLSDKNKTSVAKTVIIDEASMISEDMMAALFDSFTGVKRLILVGDPNQLPPIGPGRPFVDIISKINPAVNSKEIRIDNSFAELTVNIRHINPDKDGKDLELAKWFSEDNPSSDDLSNIINKKGYSNCISFRKWEGLEEFKKLILNVLVNEIEEIGDKKDYNGFNKSLGAIYDGKWPEYSAEGIENWQILSPVRNRTHGVMEINRLIHKQFRGGLIYSCRKGGKSSKPLGNEEIIIGDKVINISNHFRWYSAVEDFNDRDQGYLANGEIGVVSRSSRKYGVNVQFSTQKDYLFGFPGSEFSEESSTFLELAYALTVHKAQGSDFEKVFLVIPNDCNFISKELIYTALTRHKESVIILYEGDPNDILKYCSNAFSSTAKRFTDLFKMPKIIEFEDSFYEESLIHFTLGGEMVRSKSEVIIANLLHERGIVYKYEKKLIENDGYKRPDFTIVSKDGETTYYWEHLGMLNVPEYKQNWEKKLEWYIKHDILPYEKGCNYKKVLLITKDDNKGGINSKEIESIIDILKK